MPVCSPEQTVNGEWWNLLKAPGAAAEAWCDFYLQQQQQQQPAGVSARVFQRVTAAGEGFTSFALIFLKSVPGSFATDDEMTLN